MYDDIMYVTARGHLPPPAVDGSVSNGAKRAPRTSQQENDPG